MWTSTQYCSCDTRRCSLTAPTLAFTNSRSSTLRSSCSPPVPAPLHSQPPHLVKRLLLVGALVATEVAATRACVQEPLALVAVILIPAGGGYGTVVHRKGELATCGGCMDGAYPECWGCTPVPASAAAALHPGSRCPASCCPPMPAYASSQPAALHPPDSTTDWAPTLDWPAMPAT